MKRHIIAFLLFCSMHFAAQRADIPAARVVVAGTAALVATAKLIIP